VTDSSVDLVIEAIDRILDEFERGDLEAARQPIEECTHPACELTSAIGSEVEGATFVGPEEMRGWFASLVETFELRYEDRRFRPIDESTILLLTTNRLRGRGSGAEVVREIGMVFELEGPLIRKAVSYGSQEEAVDAAEARAESDVNA
jgi:hypothetical protein